MLHDTSLSFLFFKAFVWRDDGAEELYAKVVDGTATWEILVEAGSTGIIAISCLTKTQITTFLENALCINGIISYSRMCPTLSPKTQT